MQTVETMRAAEAAREPVAGTLEDWARRQPYEIAVIDEKDRSLTWQEWNRQADLLAGALEKRGLVAGDIVVVRTQTRLEWSVIAQALAKRFPYCPGRAFRSDSTATEVLYGRSGRGSCQRQRLRSRCLGLGRRLP